MIGVAPISAKLREGRLRWFGHVQRKASGSPMRREKNITIDNKRGQERPKKT